MGTHKRAVIGTRLEGYLGRYSVRLRVGEKEASTRTEQQTQEIKGWGQISPLVLDAVQP